MPTLLLIDGHSQAYRAYFGMKTPLSTRAGEPTAAVYGFARKLFSILKEYDPEYVVAAFDLGDTWRHTEYSDYKATREQMPDELRGQIERILQLLKAFNVPVVTYPNYEADDVLGTLAVQAADQGFDVLILTGDRDMFQLVTDRIKVLYTSGGPNPITSIYGPEEVKQRYGLAPGQIVDLKALTGDSSDNIPGVAGVGEKTAAKFLQQFGNVEALYANLDAVSGPKTRQSLSDSTAQVERNKRLVTIITDLDVQFDAERCQTRDYDREDVLRLFNELEFRTLAKELPQGDGSPAPAAPSSGQSGQMALFAQAEPPAPAPMQSNYLLVQDQTALDKVVAALGESDRISFDVETDSTDAMRARLVGLGVAWETGAAAYIPVAHTQGDHLPWETVRAALQPFFADRERTKIAHNGKYDLTVCRRYGLDAPGIIHDTMTLAWLLDPAGYSLGLKSLAAAELGWTMTEISELIGTGRKQITIDQVEMDRVCAYCGADVDAAIQLFDRLVPRVRQAGMWQLYEEIEAPLLPVLTDMEMAGVLLDTAYLGEMSQRLAVRLGELEEEMFRIVGHPFNLRSTQQMSQVLFDEMGFPARGMKKTASGHYSTAVGELDKLMAMSDQLRADQRRFLELIFEQRQLEKLRGTYVDALPALVNPETGRVHTSFSQTGAVTGRMSSSSPNLQNIPIRTEIGREIRRAFIAAPGCALLSADYSQVELRVMAHVAQEPALIEAFLADQDIHAATAARLFNVPIGEVSRDQRGLAKTINFATIYGSSAFGISSRTEMDPKQAQGFLDQYFATYPRIRAYVGETIRMANEEGYVQTLMGRKRFFPELQNRSLPYNQRQAVERAAINAPIQGAAADIMKLAMVRLHSRLQEEGLRSRMLLQVHDELVLETPHEERRQAAALVREVMESAYTLDVPLKVDIEIGPDWYNQEPA